jgi:hypothetical protein
MNSREGNQRAEELLTQERHGQPVVLRLRKSSVGSNRRRAIEACARRAYDHLRSLQQDDGHFCGELEGCTILESEYVLLLQFLGRGDDERIPRAGAFIRAKQEPHGGWAIYPGGPTDVSTSVKAYFVLKLVGDDPNASHMVRAREAILRSYRIARYRTPLL